MNGVDVVCVDIETTGLDPLLGSILEIGIVIADRNFIPVKSYSSLVQPLPWWELDLVEKVVDMHTRNGLLSEIRDSFDSLPTVDQVALEAKRFLVDNGVECGALPMTGSSIHFDRAWIKHHMPKLNSVFHYRNMDISSMKCFIELVHPDWEFNFDRDDKKHRALEDVRNTLAEAAYYKTLLKQC